MTDKSYTPIDTEFRAVMDRVYGECRFSDAQIDVFRDVFFAGAAAAVGYVKDNPLSQTIIEDELIDHADHLQAA